jgi:hypothetical protein
MSIQLDEMNHSAGTRFRIFSQPPNVVDIEPEVIRVSVLPNQIKEGPEDDRMFIVDAIDKIPYDEGPGNGPPYSGRRNNKVQSGPDGHFDHLPVGSREFMCAGAYATVRRVLDIWEDYLKAPIPWHFAARFEKLEIIPFVNLTNSQAGDGYLEFGYGRNEHHGRNFDAPYCQNFDVVAHELGHLIIYSVVGKPLHTAGVQIDYNAMHEAFSDLIAIISLLHFDSVVKRLLDATKGNLFTVNELERVGELSKSLELRTAFNSVRMHEVGEGRHDRSRPLTGAIFDIFVEVFQKKLVKAGLILQDLANRSTQGPGGSPDLEQIQGDFNDAYLGNESKFAHALLEARDYLGYLLAEVMNNPETDLMTFHDIILGLSEADRRISGGEYQDTISECFAWREITIPGR